MSRFQVSKFKNIELNQSANFGTGPLCNINEWPNNTTFSQLIHSSASCIASFIGHGTVTVFSSLSHHKHLLDIHVSSICDLNFSPFQDDLLSVTSQDKYTILYRLPITLNSENEFISTENCAHEVARISAPNSKLKTSRFHSIVSDILVQTSNNEFSFIKIDSSSQDYKKVLSNKYSDDEKFLNFAFSETSLDFAVLKENSGILLYDPRTNVISQETAFETYLKNCPQIGFLENGGSPCMLTTNNNCVQIWDRRSFTLPISNFSTQNNSKLIPLIDFDTGLTFFVTYNSGLVMICEEKQLLSGNEFNNSYSTYLSHKFRSITLTSKRALKYDIPEIDRLYALTDSNIIPMQFTVPRKVSQNFFSEYFPSTKSPYNQKNWSEIISNDDLIKVQKMNLHPQVYSFFDKISLINKTINPIENINKDDSLYLNHQNGLDNNKIETNSKNEFQHLPQADRNDRNIVPKCKFLRGTVDFKKRIEFKEEIYDGISSLRLMKIGKNLAVLPLGRNACDTLAFINLINGQFELFQTGSCIMDFAVDPFLEESGRLVCVGTNTGDIYLFDVNINDQKINIKSSHLSVCHNGAIVRVLFHSLFSSTLITVGKEDNLVKIWTITDDIKLNNVCSQALVSGSDSIYEIAWSKFRNGGNHLATLVKTKESIEKIVVFEYCKRSFKFVHEIILSKFCFIVSLDWIVRDEFILATGRHHGEMKLFIWDTVDNFRIVSDISVDSNPYSLYTHFDEDTGTLFLIPKGDRQIYIYGLQFDENDRTLKLHRYDSFQTGARVLACCFRQKTHCDVMKMEIANGYVLNDALIAPFSLVVPRKNMQHFDDSLFPTTIPYWKSHFKDVFEINEPSKYDSLERYSLQPKGIACSSIIINNSSQNQTNIQTAKPNITINEALNNPYLAMKFKNQIESSLSTIISNFVINDNIGRGEQNFNDESEDEEADWD